MHLDLHRDVRLRRPPSSFWVTGRPSNGRSNMPQLTIIMAEKKHVWNNSSAQESQLSCMH